MRKTAPPALALLLLAASAAPALPAEGLSFDGCIVLAIRNNAALRQARAGGAAARGRALQAAAALLPQVTGTVSRSRTYRQNLAAQGFPAGGPFQTLMGPYNTFDARLQLVQEVFDLAAFDRARAARAGERIAAMEESLAEESVAAAAALAYIELFRSRQAIAAAQADAALAASLRQLAEDKKEAGTAAGIDVARARTREAEARLRLVEARNAAADAEVRLQRVAGLPFGQAVTLADEPGLRPAPAPAAGDAVAAARRDRWEMRIAAERLDASRTLRRAEADGRLPTVAAAGDVGLSGPEAGSTARTTGRAGVALRVPLFSGRAVEGRVAEADGRSAADEAALDGMGARVEEDVRLSLADLDAAVDRVATATEVERLAADELEMARDRFAAGVADNVELLNSQTALSYARDARVAALARFQTARISLAMALGRMRGFQL